VQIISSTSSAPAMGDGPVLRVDEAMLDDYPGADARGWRRMSLSSKLAYLAVAHARLAWDDAVADAGDQVGVVIGSRYGCLSLFEEFHRALRDEGPRAVSPTVFTTGVLNAPAGHASLGQGLRGPCHTLVGGEAAGLEAIALAWELIQSGSLKYAFAVGVEEAPPILIEALRAGSALSPARPVSEGAWCVLLAESALAETPVIGAVATGRCGRGHDSAARHAVLLRQAAGGAIPAFVDLPGLPGADGERERAAARIAFGEDVTISASPLEGYAPGLISACVGGRPLGYAFDRPVIATAAGGRGNTVAIRFDPPSPSA
jgi:hypothetical protein